MYSEYGKKPRGSLRCMPRDGQATWTVRDNDLRTTADCPGVPGLGGMP